MNFRDAVLEAVLTCRDFPNCKGCKCPCGLREVEKCDSGKKKLRLCPSQGKKVVCDGFCNVVFDNDVVHICSMREKALDLALNCR